MAGAVMRIGIVGCGFIGAKRASAARGHEVAFVCDLSAERAAALAATTGATVAQTWQDLVASDIDAVVVATTHDTLPVVGLAALQHGQHVLVEKPGARNASDLRPMVEEAARRALVAKVGFNHRFHPSMQKA